MKIGFIIVFLSSLFLFACNKSSEVESDVWIRISNATAVSMEETKVGMSVYGNVTAGHMTDYMKMELPVYTGNCSFKVSSQPQYAGVLICGTPSPAAFAPGHYTFTIKDLGQGIFDVEVRKD